MNTISRIRARLGVTQSAMAGALNVTQGNISHYERGGQELRPEIAKKLIKYAKSLGHELTFDDIYASFPQEFGACSEITRDTS